MSELLFCAACGMDAPYYDADGRCPLCSHNSDNGHAQIDTENRQKRVVESSATYDLEDSSFALQRRAIEVIEFYGGQRRAAVALSEQLGEKVNHGVIGLAASGEDFPKARRILGLPPKTIEVIPCPDCGKVHKQRKACQPSRKTEDHNMVYRLNDEEFSLARAVGDNHPGGRSAWLMECVRAELARG